MEKKIVYCIIIGFVIVIQTLSVGAQDTIIMKNGEKKLANIIMVGRKNISYQLYPESDMEKHVLDVEEICEVHYKNGNYIKYCADENNVDKINFKNNVVMSQVNPPYKNPAVAFLLSSIIPGLGQMYNDQVGKGFLFLGVFIFSGSLSTLFLSIYDNTPLAFVPLIASVGSYVWQWIDAPITANRLNKQNGYVVSLAPTMLQNNFALNGSARLAPGLSLSLLY